MVHDYTDSSALLSHVNTSLEQTRRDNIFSGQSVPCLIEACAL